MSESRELISPVLPAKKKKEEEEKK